MCYGYNNIHSQKPTPQDLRKNIGTKTLQTGTPINNEYQITNYLYFHIHVQANQANVFQNRINKTVLNQHHI